MTSQSRVCVNIFCSKNDLFNDLVSVSLTFQMAVSEVVDNDNDNVLLLIMCFHIVKGGDTFPM